MYREKRYQPLPRCAIYLTFSCCFCIILTLCCKVWCYYGALSLALFFLTICILWYEQICYFFFKNITFGFTLFWFEAHAMFSAQPAYNDWFISFYNVAFTSLPVIALGVFDKDVSSRVCLEVCNLLSDLYIIWSWNQIFVALHRFISFLPNHFLNPLAYHRSLHYI